MANIDHFRSSESLGQRSKVVEHTHKPQGGRRFQPSISFRSKVRDEKRFFRFLPNSVFPLVDIDHFRSSERLGQERKVVEHTQTCDDQKSQPFNYHGSGVIRFLIFSFFRSTLKNSYRRTVTPIGDLKTVLESWRSPLQKRYKRLGWILTTYMGYLRY